MEVATAGLRPDVYLVLDVPVEEGAVRRRASGGSADRIEGRGAPTFCTRSGTDILNWPGPGIAWSW